MGLWGEQTLLSQLTSNLGYLPPVENYHVLIDDEQALIKLPVIVIL